MRKLSAFRFVVTWVVISLFTLQPILSTSARAAPPSSNANPASMPLPPGQLPAYAPNTPAPSVVPRDLPLEQYHYVYSTHSDGRGQTVDLVSQKYLLTQIDVTNPTVFIQDYSRDVRAVYDQSTRTLLFQRVVFDKNLKRLRVTDAHAFENFDVTSNIAFNANELVFNEAAGVRGILMKNFITSFGAKPIVAPVVLPAPEGHSIVELQYQTPEVDPGDVKDPIMDGDLHVRFDTGERTRVKRSEVIQNLAFGYLGALLQMIQANPNLQQLESYQKMISDNAEDVARFNELGLKVLDGTHNDAARHAFRAMGQKTDFNELGRLFEKDAQGLNEFQRLINAPRNTYSAATGEKNRALIAEGKAKDAAAGRPIRTWQQIQVDSFNNFDPDIIKESAKAENRMLRRIVGRIFNTFQTYATKTNILGATIILSAIAYSASGYGSNTPQHWWVSGITNFLNWTTQVPIIAPVAEQINKSSKFLINIPSRWAYARLAFGVALMAIINPLSYRIAGGIAKLRNDHRDSVDAFFTYGTRLYARLNTPLQKLGWDAAQHKDVYPIIVDNNVSPWTGEIYHSPLASKEDVQQSRERLNVALDMAAAKRGRALILAAAMVAEVSTNSGQPIDIATLLLGSEGQPVAAFEDLITNAALHPRWVDLTYVVHRALTGIGDVGGDVDPREMGKYVQMYQEVVDRFKREANGKVRYTLRVLTRRALQVMSQNIAPFMLFGKQGYTITQRLKNADVSTQNLQVVTEMYNVDYQTGNVIYAASDSKKFADLAILGVGAPEVIANQLSQAIVFSQTAVDPPDPREGLKNSYPPFSDQLYAGMGEREVEFKTSVKDLLKKAFRPGEASALGQHYSMMQKMVEGFQVRIFSDFAVRLVASYVTLQVAGDHKPFADLILATVMSSSYFLLSKLSFQFNSNGFAPGYATIWPYAITGMRGIQDAAAESSARLKRADSLLTTALDTKDQNMLVEAVREMQNLYVEGTGKIPSRFNVAPEKMDLKLAEGFLEYRLNFAPIPTKMNSKLFLAFNGVGTSVSTVLFPALSAISYYMTTNSQADPKSILLNSLVWFAGTAVAVKVAQKVADPVLANVVQPVTEKIGSIREKLRCYRAVVK